MQSKLTIPEVRAEDAGTYICTARNNIETTEIPTILVVTGVVPYFTQAPISYMQMPTLPDAYQQFDIEISFKPESPDGNWNMILPIFNFSTNYEKLLHIIIRFTTNHVDITSIIVLD